MREAAAATANTPTGSTGTGTPAAGRLTVAPQDLERFIATVLRGCAVSERDAATTAGILARTDAWGVFTHGVKCLAGYVARLRAGGLDPRAIPRVEREGPAWAVVDGGAALGMVTSVMAMDLAIAKARAAGVGFVGVRNSCHFGAAGAYAIRAAEAGMIGIAMANDKPSMIVPGARGRVLGNNPLAIAVPCPDGPVLLDMALSTVAGGKIMAARYAGAPIPADWSVDASGEPTTDPQGFLGGGALTPVGGHKGAGLALAVEVLAAVLTGAGVTEEVGAWLHDLDRPSNHGAAFLVLDIAQFLPLADFLARMAALAGGIRAAPRRDGCARISLPGELEQERAAAARAHGIDLPPDVADAVRALAAGSGLALADHGFRPSVPAAPTTAPSRAMP